MTAIELLLTGWDWDPLVLVTLTAASIAYARLVGRRGRPGYFIAAMALLILALLSPMSLLASGVLFTAHMTQHILLLVFVPALLLLSLPITRSGTADGDVSPSAGPASVSSLAVLGWVLGVGSMWFWHAPMLCDAAATRPSVHALQTATLLAAGAAFWWPVFSPRIRDRLVPGYGVAYLFTACLACSALGILITLTPVEVCAAFSGPVASTAGWHGLRESLGFARDQQIGGLIMWMPMCLVYAGAIILELMRWLDDGRRQPAAETNP